MQSAALPDEADLPALLETFYGRVRRDEMLGPVFEAAVDDWPAHLGKLAAFWSSVMLTTGRYKGQPVAAHLAHADRIRPGMFDRWLEIWRECTEASLPAPAARAMQEKAERIAESLGLALAHPSVAQRRAMPTASMPYRSTPVFDQDTLPQALRREHSTKAGTWGVIRVLEGRLAYHPENGGASIIATPLSPVIIAPQAPHRVEPLGPMRMRVDFYDHKPANASPSRVGTSPPATPQEARP